MKPISTGTGLIVLSATIATCFAASRFGGEERAFAESWVSRNSVTNRLADKEIFQEATSVQSPTSCEIGPANWLSSTPHFVTICDGVNGVGVAPLYAADINADGRSESFALNYSTYANVLNGGQLTGEAIRISLAALAADSDGNQVYRSQTVFDSNAALPTIRLLYPWATFIYWYASLGLGGWNDMDGDRDLDLVFMMEFWDGAPLPAARIARVQVWYENTGFQASPPPNPYDLDQDGEVGAGDISVLLLNYSG